MATLLIANPLILLFVVATLGYLLGRIRIGGFSLGTAAILFVGLAVGAIDPNLKLPELVYQLGLVLFVYTIGLNSGATFLSSLRQKGLQDNLLAAGGLAAATGLVLAISLAFHLSAATSAGVFVGSLTNTPALAAVLESLKLIAPPAELERLLSDPVVAYSLTYPGSVIGLMLLIHLFQRIWKIDYGKEAERGDSPLAAHAPLEHRTVLVTCAEIAGQTVQEITRRRGWNVVFGRVCRQGELSLATAQTVFQMDDLVSIIGAQEDLDRVTAVLGEASETRLEQDLTKFDRHKMIVSNGEIGGRRLQDLAIFPRFGALVTRIRHGDVELLPRGDSILNLGDTVRVLVPHDQVAKIADYFGNSSRDVSEVNVFTFSLGLAAGLLLGLAPIPLGGAGALKLGMAGGPLIVALILGAIGRTGPLIWNIPYNTNLTLRQIGLILFMAGIGTRSGYAFVSTVAKGDGLLVVLLGAGVTLAIGLLVLVIGYRGLHIPMGKLIGILAGIQTQPALLGFAQEQAKNELPDLGYATVYPLATLMKILLVQVILAVLFRP